MTNTDGQLTRFAACVYEPSDLVEVRLLRSGRSLWQPAGELGRLAEQLTAENGNGQHVHIGINPRMRNGGRSKADIALARVLFADLDDTSPEAARKRWESAGLPEPTLIVASGHGVHTYWRLTEPVSDLAAWTQWQRDLAAVLASDPVVHDPPRLARMPGFTNHKEPAASCSIVDADPTRVYDLADLHEHIPPSAEPDTPTQPAGDTTHQGLAVIARAAAYLNKVPGAVQGHNGDDRTYKAACTLVQDFGLSIEQAYPLLAEWNHRCDPPWPEAELREKLSHASKYATGVAGSKADRQATSIGKTGVPPTDSLHEEPGPDWLTIPDIRRLPTYAKGLPPISTGFSALNTPLRGGLRPECVYVVAGRTGTSKSTLVLNIARKVALDGNGVLLFKLEESPKEALWRIHAAAAQVRLDALLDGLHTASEEDRNGLDDGWGVIHDLPIRLSDNRQLVDIRRISRAHVNDGGKLIIVDQLGMVADPSMEPGYQLATAVSNTLRRLAVDLHVPILVVCQVNRAASKGKDHLSINDLRDSGAIEHDATGVILIDKPRPAKGQHWAALEPLFFLDIIVGKNRYGPRTDPDRPVTLQWWPAMCRIEDVARSVAEAER